MHKQLTVGDRTMAKIRIQDARDAVREAKRREWEAWRREMNTFPRLDVREPESVGERYARVMVRNKLTMSY